MIIAVETEANRHVLPAWPGQTLANRAVIFSDQPQIDQANDKSTMEQARTPKHRADSPVDTEPAAPHTHYVTLEPIDASTSYVEHVIETWQGGDAFTPAHQEILQKLLSQESSLLRTRRERRAQERRAEYMALREKSRIRALGSTCLNWTLKKLHL